MNKKEFYNEFHEFLEIESVESFNSDTNLKELDEYDSFTIMSMIAFIDENFSTKLTATQLNAIVTIKDVIDLIGNDKFDD
jgi:acyl carrier protein